MKITRRTKTTFTTTEIVETRTISLYRISGKGFCTSCGNETGWVEIEDISQSGSVVPDHFHSVPSKIRSLRCVGALEKSIKEKNDE